MGVNANGGKDVYNVVVTFPRSYRSTSTVGHVLFIHAIKDGKVYYFYNYPNKIWANIKCTAYGLESKWVWIPRFAYKLESGESSVILIDKNNNPIDKQTYGNS